MSDHNTKSLGEAIRAFIEAMKWTDNFNQASIISDWEKIVGRDIAMSTTEIRFMKGVLTISLNSATLRQELHMRRKSLLKHINDFYGNDLVKEIRLK
ncbi:MAG TPA: hypothetical protein DDY04_01560 [Bacteroidales bacterium]|nr:hypothetical protein [Bacteroidales bacterium]